MRYFCNYQNQLFTVMKKEYCKPIMGIEIFNCNECVSLCDEITLVNYNPNSFLPTLYEDKIYNGKYDDDEQLADNMTMPDQIIMDMENSIFPYGFYKDNDFRNLAANSGRYFYIRCYKGTYQSKDKRYVIYAVCATDGNIYYFESKPTLSVGRNHS